jgi:hypothetical protein
MNHFLGIISLKLLYKVRFLGLDLKKYIRAYQKKNETPAKD